MTLPSKSSYPVGEVLVHHSGSRWVVVETDLPGEALRPEDRGMIPMAGDYRIECCRPGGGSRVGTQHRVHADYLHGDGWKVAP